jgi:hypothetical protein
MGMELTGEGVGVARRGSSSISSRVLVGEPQKLFFNPFTAWFHKLIPNPPTNPWI